MSQSKPAADASGFEMDVQEDVAAEREAFILRSRLDKALWHHLNFFPVFAEVAVYIVEREDSARFSRLKTKVSEQNLVFAKAEEKDFVKTFITLYQSSGLELLPDSLNTRIPDGSEGRSPIQVSPNSWKIQKRQIHMTIMVQKLLKLEDITLVGVAITMVSLECEFLISEGFAWQASRMLSLAFLLASKHAMNVFVDHQRPHIDRTLMLRTQYDLSARYEDLMSLVEDDLLLKAKDMDRKAGELLTSVQAKLSFAKILCACQKKDSSFMLFRRPPYKYDFSEIYKDATERLRMVFQLLPDPSMRGEYADNLQSPDPAIPHPVARALTQSTIEPPPAKPDHARLSQERRELDQPSKSLADRFDQGQLASASQNEQKQTFEDIQVARRNAQKELALLGEKERKLQMNSGNRDINRFSSDFQKMGLNEPISELTPSPGNREILDVPFEAGESKGEVPLSSTFTRFNRESNRYSQSHRAADVIQPPFQSSQEAATMESLDAQQEQKQSRKSGHFTDSSKPHPSPKPAGDAGIIFDTKSLNRRDWSSVG
ncbi:hypothetical protein LTR70_003546 [Exophiala xenobiotica]|uniref:Cyclin N-terminal domain-containing protein n=1 Tax=Lithohypha guttulata TaxID=1690604 RepID=A0ABR0KHV7_9EURO|nr:hypothetical protein LTR24_003094 [Lithohypha guttulata]KAK5322925.1 hypothetical protein LTR70_003546 [Exophiala xenobiotica]